MNVMYTQTQSEKRLGLILTTVMLLFAVWLVSPFFHIDRSSYAHAREYGYRLAFGLMILIMFVGKSAFDTFAPQGLARKVSDAKGIALIALMLLILGFIVFIVAQATVLYLKTAAEVEQQQQTIINQLP